MEWEKYWNWLLSEKKFTLLVREMDEAADVISFMSAYEFF